MSRIRSLHPGIYTDEAWATVSIAARWLGMGLCTEADDNGVFEWKPVQIKMRLFPADAIDVAELLAELSSAGIVEQFDADGRSLGAVRNFCKYQRPRKPKTWFPITDSIKEFVAFSVPQKSEPDDLEPEPVPPKSENPPQMKEEGCKREKEETEANASAAEAAPIYSDSRHELWGEGKAILAQLGVPPKTAGPNIGRWLKAAGDDAHSVLSAIQRARDHRIVDPIPWITQALKAPNGTRHRDNFKRPAGDAIVAGMARAFGFGDGGLAGPAKPEVPAHRHELDLKPNH